MSKLKTIAVFILTACTLSINPSILASNHVNEDAAVIRYDSINHPVIGRYGMVVSQRQLASQVGADILARGGNAVDAAVATAMALTVTLPRAGNIGGGGFMLIYLAESDRTIAIDYREMAPGGAHKDLFLNEDGSVNKHRERFSHFSSGVPGTVAGLAHALTNYGTMSWSEVLQPAIALARDGIEVSWDLSENLKSRQAWLTENKATAATYYKPDLSPYQPGERLIQTDLARTLNTLAQSGPEDFYTGSIARKIANEMQAGGGLINMQDLAAYKAIERTAVETNYRGYRIASMPPPSSGGIHVLQMLNILENYPMDVWGQGSAASVHLITEAMKLAYADRSQHLGDPDFFDVPIEGLISKAYAGELSKDISLKKARPSADILPGQPAIFQESPDTTHFSIMDSAGNAVANTYTLNFSFGSGIVVPGTGILMNNEMADFSAKTGVPDAFGLLGREANSIQPGKRPLSSMTPTIVFRDGKPLLVTGSPGGSRIINAVLQILVNVMEFDMNIANATQAPRIHHQWQPDRLELEPGFSPDTRKLLEQMGHNIKDGRSMGSLQSVMWKDGLFYGASDTRRPGAGVVALNHRPQRITNNAPANASEK